MATKRKHSIFCIKKPIAKGIGYGAVFLKDENVWVLVRGKMYQNGYFRYIHNGREAKVGPYNWRNFKNYSYNQMESEVADLNVSVLDRMVPSSTSPKFRRRPFAAFRERMAAIEIEEDPYTIFFDAPDGNHAFTLAPDPIQ